MTACPDTARPDLGALLRPQSIAVLGASDRSGVGRRIMQNLAVVGFAGELLAVNARHAQVGGRRAYPSLSELPLVPDLLVAAVNREAAVRGIGEASRMGCRAAVVLAAGFAESGGRGRELDAQLRGAVGQMAVLGPNCLGFVNLVDRVAAYSGPMMEPPERGSVALISQSGALACAFTGAGAERGISFSHVITTGNQVGLGLADYLRFMAGEPAVRVVAAYLEGFTDGRDLLAAMDMVTEAGKAVVVLKAGRSSVGGAAARTHTGALAGSAQVQLSVWRRHGVLVASDPEEFLALMELCSRGRSLAGPRVGILTISGGERLLMADAAEDAGLELADFRADTAQRLSEILPDYAAVSNPLDTTGAGVVDGNPDVHRRAADVVSHDANVDLIVACQDAKNGWLEARRASDLFHDCVVAATEAAAAAGKPLVVISPSAGEVDERARGYLRQHSVPFLMGLRPAMASLAQVVHREFGAGSLLPPASSALPASAGAGRTVSGYQALARLAAQGVPPWPTEPAASADDAVRIARAAGFPVVMKLDGPGLQHRTEAGGVLTDLGTESAVRSAWAQLTARAAELPSAAVAVLVQPMASRGVEIFVGGFRDEQFGPVLLCGSGGVLVELCPEVVSGLAPVSEAEAADLLRATRAFPLLRGFRGGSPADLAALTAAIAAISRVVAEPDVLALDVNPLIALPEGVAMVDAKLVLAAGARDPEPGS